MHPTVLHCLFTENIPVLTPTRIIFRCIDDKTNVMNALLIYTDDTADASCSSDLQALQQTVY
jgi:hypothetical protein